MHVQANTKGWPVLARTEKALRAYDAKWGDNFDPTQDGELAVAVGEAFGLDTADRNNTADCKALVRPGSRFPRPGFPEPFVRNLVRVWVEAGRPCKETS